MFVWVAVLPMLELAASSCGSDSLARSLVMLREREDGDSVTLEVLTVVVRR